jgi:hypothetical protein
MGGAIPEGPTRGEEGEILARIRQAVGSDHPGVVDMDPERFIDIIQGIRPPSSLDIALIADACKVSSWWLITGEADPCQCIPVAPNCNANPGASEWSRDCPMHGVDSDWYNDLHQVEARARRRRELIDLQSKARQARESAP